MPRPRVGRGGCAGRAQLGAHALFVVAERASEQLVQLGRHLLGRRLAALALALRRAPPRLSRPQRSGAAREARIGGLRARTISSRTARSVRGARGGAGTRRRVRERARKRRRGRRGRWCAAVRTRLRRSGEDAAGLPGYAGDAAPLAHFPGRRVVVRPSPPARAEQQHSDIDTGVAGCNPSSSHHGREPATLALGTCQVTSS